MLKVTESHSFFGKNFNSDFHSSLPTEALVHLTIWTFTNQLRIVDLVEILANSVVNRFHQSIKASLLFFLALKI